MNQNKLNLTQALVVEGKYDAARLANLVDATILTTDGFAIFKDKTMQALFRGCIPPWPRPPCRPSSRTRTPLPIPICMSGA